MRRRVQAMQLRRRAYASNYLAQVLVMSEVDDLSGLRHLGEQAEGFLGAKIVERLHDIVGDERHSAATTRELIISCNPKREVKPAYPSRVRLPLSSHPQRKAR